MKAGSGSQLELDAPMKPVLFFQASMLHSMTAEKPMLYEVLHFHFPLFMLYKLVV